MGSFSIDADGNVFLHHDREEFGALTWHRHDAQGYQPPSIRDLDLLALRKTGAEHHIVVAARGVFHVYIRCAMPPAVLRKLKTEIRRLQTLYPPSDSYDALYLLLVNAAAPECFHVDFV